MHLVPTLILVLWLPFHCLWFYPGGDLYVQEVTKSCQNVESFTRRNTMFMWMVSSLIFVQLKICIFFFK